MQTTARQIITPALQLIGVIAANEAGNAADVDTAFHALNDIVDAWSVMRNNLLAETEEIFPLIVGQASYTVGIGGDFNTDVPIAVLESSFVRFQGIDWPLRQITNDVYSAIPYKINPGIPEVYLFDRSATLGTLTFYPVPPDQETLYLHSLKPISTFPALDTNVVLAPSYKETLKFSLAESLCPLFERDVPKFVAVQAIKLRRALKRANVVVPTMEIGFVPAWTGSNYPGGAGFATGPDNSLDYIVPVP